MTDIKELAHEEALDKLAHEVDEHFGKVCVTRDSRIWLLEFTQRFLAAYLAEQVSPAKAQALDALDCLDDFARMADIDPVGPRKVLEDYINGAAPSSEEVLEMVERLRALNPLNTDADLIERLAARVPDGCVEKYNELLYAVEHKFPNETRHETALRYIKQTEQRANSGSPADAAGEVKP
jgi:hypothetical protein